MLTNCIFIDTNIWYYAYVIPKRLEFVEIHNRASQFLTEKLEDTSFIIAITTHQIAEILDVLRKSALSDNIRKAIMESFKTPKFHIVNLKENKGTLFPTLHNYQQRKCSVSVYGIS